PIVRQLLAHDEDAGDIHQPLLLWWAIEAKCATDPGGVLALFHDSVVWRTRIAEETILTRLMRRFAAAGSQKDLRVCTELFRMAPERKHGLVLLKGFEEAYQGRSSAGLPPELLEEIAKLGGGSIAFAVRQGKAEAVARAFALAKNGKTPLSQREELVGALGEVNQPAAVPVLLDLLTAKEPDSLRRAALTALQAY